MKKLFTKIRITRRKLLRTIFGFFSLSGMLFVFQCCYGTPQDFGLDVLIEGQVLSEKTQDGIPDIKISVDNLGQYSRSAEDGTFAFYCPREEQYQISFTDEDGDFNGTYQPKDTVLQVPEIISKVQLNIKLD